MRVRGLAHTAAVLAVSSVSVAGCSGDNDGGGAAASGATSRGGSATAGASSGGTSSGGASSGGSVGSSLPGNAVLGTLSAAEFDQLCSELEAFASSPAIMMSSEELACRLAGLLGAAFSGAQTDAEVRAACHAVYDPCSATPGTSSTTCNQPSASCTATVSEFWACMNDTAAGLTQAVESMPSCDELTLADLMGTGGAAGETTSAACQTLEQKCPDAPAMSSM